MDLASLERSLDDAHRRLREIKIQPYVSPPQPPPVALSKERLNTLAADKSQFFLEMERRKQEEAGCNAQARRVPLQVAMEQGNRLYQESFRREEKRQSERYNREEAKSLSLLSPTLPALFSAPDDLPPLHERADSIIKQREQELNRLRKQREEEQKALRQSKYVTVVDLDHVTERLANEAQAREARRERERNGFLEANKNRGKPEINPHSRELARKSHGDLPFLERQERIMQSKVMQRQQQQQQGGEEDLNSSHCSSSSSLIVLTPNRMNRMITRLAEEDAVEIKMKRLAKQEDYFSKLYPFRPKIDTKSRNMAPSGSGGVEALFLNESAMQRKEMLKQRVEAEVMKECTFHPTLPPETQKRRTQEEWRQKCQEKLERLERTRFEQKMKEAEECTFRPYINPAPPAPTVPANLAIKGMDTHLQRQRMVEERRLAQKEREDKAFLTTLPPLNRRYTVAQPFRLSVSVRRSPLEEEEDDDYDY